MLRYRRDAVPSRRRPRAQSTRRLWLLGLTLALVACSPPVGGATGAAPGVIFQDDFTQPTSGWDRHTGADVTTDYVGGRYLIAVEDPGVDVWARPGLELADVVVEADSQYGAGPVNNEFGVLCRYSRGSDGKNSFYFFLVSSDGYYALGKVARDVRTVLQPEDGSFQPSSAIVQGPDAINRLAATCAGTHFSLSVNGTLVGVFEDGELARGDVGLIAGTFDEGGVRLYFDNVLVRTPG